MEPQKDSGALTRLDDVSDEPLNEKLSTVHDRKDMDRLGKLQQLRVGIFASRSLS